MDFGKYVVAHFCHYIIYVDRYSNILILKNAFDWNHNIFGLYLRKMLPKNTLHDRSIQNRSKPSISVMQGLGQIVSKLT